MPYQSIPDVLGVTITGHTKSGVWQNNLVYTWGDPPNEDDWQQFGQDVLTAYAPILQNCSVEVVVDGARVYDLLVPRVHSTYTPPAVAITGAIPGAPLPMNITALVDFVGFAAYRGGHGRINIPGIPSEAVLNDVLVDNYIAALTEDAQGILSVETVGGVRKNLVLAHRTTGTTTAIDSLKVRAVIGQMGKRRNGYGQLPSALLSTVQYYCADSC